MCVVQRAAQQPAVRGRGEDGGLRVRAVQRAARARLQPHRRHGRLPRQPDHLQGTCIFSRPTNAYIYLFACIV